MDVGVSKVVFFATKVVVFCEQYLDLYFKLNHRVS